MSLFSACTTQPTHLFCRAPPSAPVSTRFANRDPGCHRLVARDKTSSRLTEEPAPPRPASTPPRGPPARNVRPGSRVRDSSLSRSVSVAGGVRGSHHAQRMRRPYNPRERRAPRSHCNNFARSSQLASLDVRLSSSTVQACALVRLVAFGGPDALKDSRNALRRAQRRRVLLRGGRPTILLSTSRSLYSHSGCVLWPEVVQQV